MTELNDTRNNFEFRSAWALDGKTMYKVEGNNKNKF